MILEIISHVNDSMIYWELPQSDNIRISCHLHKLSALISEEWHNIFLRKISDDKEIAKAFQTQCSLSSILWNPFLFVPISARCFHLQMFSTNPFNYNWGKTSLPLSSSPHPRQFSDFSDFDYSPAYFPYPSKKSALQLGTV